MAEVSAKDVAALRKLTGAGMMDCKRALQETGGDLDEATKWLREKGLAGAAKRGGRSADQGAVDVAVVGTVGAIVELNCETDFVAKGDDFRQTVAQLAQQAAADPSDLGTQAYAGGGETVDTTIKALGSKLGENIQLGRVVRLDAEGGVVDAYKHIQFERGVIGVLVVLTGVDPNSAEAQEVAHDVALHVASAAPGWTRREDVPAEIVEAERQVLENLTRNEGKPEQALDKIVQGRLNGFFKDKTLLEQGFVKEPKTTVSQVVGRLGPEATVRTFARVKIGEE